MADSTSGDKPTGRESRNRDGAKRESSQRKSSAGASAGRDTDTVSLPRPRVARDPARPPRKPSRNRLTGRAGILALALCAVMVTVAYPLRQYLAQRSQISDLRHQNQVTQQQVAALQSELDKWSDPAYVAIQARERLHYVRPGETGYIVPNPSASSEPLGIPSPTQQPWYDQLWSTVKSPSPSSSPSPTQ